MQKVQILGMKKDLPQILTTLQKKGVVQIVDVIGTENLKEIDPPDHKADYDIANIDFALTFLKNHATKRPIWAGKPTLTAESALGILNSFDYETVVKECQELEEKHNKNLNKFTSLENEETILEKWKNLPFELSTPKETETVRLFIGTLPTTEFETLRKELHNISNLSDVHRVSEDTTFSLVVVTISKNSIDEAKLVLGKCKFAEVELPKHDMSTAKRLETIEAEKTNIKADLEEQEKEFIRLAQDYENLQIVHDIFLWQQDEKHARELLRGTAYSFIITGWIPKDEKVKLEEALEKISSNIAIQAIEPEKDEETPILLRNRKAAWPFESVTRLYGLPMAHEVDPTPFLAGFFIVFFALCLTDAGYGLLLFVIMFAALKFFNLPHESKGLIKLLMWGGLVTMVAGVLFGGYFGLTPEQAPGFLVGEDGNFRFQLINATSGTGPLTFLILALVFGIVHVLFGKLLDGFWKIKQGQYLDAVLDSFLWVFFILSILGFGLSSSGMVIPADYANIFKWLTLGGVVAMILTQGRSQKSIIGKFGLGVLSLYGLVGYLGDVLSYSRLMALGLGTGIIAFAMNTIAGLAIDMIPYVGFIFAIIVLILGHTMNLVLSALGAFIHSARLQFVEFFGKFMEGGGTEFKPFRRQCKYIIIQ